MSSFFSFERFFAPASSSYRCFCYFLIRPAMTHRCCAEKYCRLDNVPAHHVCARCGKKVHNHCCGIQDNDKGTCAICAGGRYSDLAMLCLVKEGDSLNPDKASIALAMSQTQGLSEEEMSTNSLDNERNPNMVRYLNLNCHTNCNKHYISCFFISTYYVYNSKLHIVLEPNHLSGICLQD